MILTDWNFEANSLTLQFVHLWGWDEFYAVTETDILPSELGVGFLASDAEDFAILVDRAVKGFESPEIQGLISRAKLSLDRFVDDEGFGARFAQLVAI